MEKATRSAVFGHHLGGTVFMRDRVIFPTMFKPVSVFDATHNEIGIVDNASMACCFFDLELISSDLILLNDNVVDKV